jgi:L-arabinonolactonase
LQIQDSQNLSAPVSAVAGIDNYLGEGPIWSVRDQMLWWVNCEQPAELHRLAPGENGKHDVWPMPARIGGFVEKESGGLLIALADGVYDFDIDSGKLALRAKANVPAHVALHECHCDRFGRFWVGSYDHHFNSQQPAPGDGFIFRLDGDVLTPVIPGIRIANGMAFSPDGRTMYVSDSPTRVIDAYDIDSQGNLSGRREFVRMQPGEGFVDGATVDSEGGYWLAAVSAASLRRYLPDGTFDQLFELPCSNPTKLAFGGPDLRSIYVTSTKLPIPPCRRPETVAGNGGLYALQTGHVGVAESKLAD